MKVYDISIDMLDETGLDAISLVEYPAVEVNFLVFNKDHKLQFVDNEKHIITGVALLADTPIYRVAPDGTEYYVNFSKETIKKLVEKYFKVGFGNSVNIEHSAFVDNVILIESYIIDKERNICPVEFSAIPDGSWVVSYKVNNPDVWEKIKSGEVKGFSVQGLFSLIEEKFENKHKVKNMKSLKEALRSILLQFDGVQTDKGELTWNGDKQLEVGDEVYIDEVPAPDGDYVADDKVFIVKDGKVEEIKDKEPETPETEELEEVVEVAPEVPEKPQEITDLENRVAELENSIAEIIERVAKLETSPVVEPVVDEFEQINKKNSTGNKTVDKYSRIFGSLK